jgi:hypothetical protein
VRAIYLIVIGAALAASACDTRTNASVARPDTLRAVKGDILLSLETSSQASEAVFPFNRPVSRDDEQWNRFPRRRVRDGEDHVLEQVQR